MLKSKQKIKKDTNSKHDDNYDGDGCDRDDYNEDDDDADDAGDVDVLCSCDVAQVALVSHTQSPLSFGFVLKFNPASWCFKYVTHSLDVNFLHYICLARCSIGYISVLYSLA